MHFFQFQFSLFLIHIATVQGFQPSLASKIDFRIAPLDSSSIPHSSYYEHDPVSEMDLEHAHDCADHFGKCPIGELEDMKKALKTERIQIESLGIVLDPQEEVDHRLLEEDLTLQIAILKDEIPPTPLYNLKKPDVKPARNNAVAAVADYVEQGEELFLMPNGIGDTFAFGASLFIIAMAPLILQH
mmetsp:Transcript_10121/g.11827  ORF Transcript_10121/g.11827 Transcript_10121/m.11827 type:complete len:186 (-) Transcript_10121:298-855(-)